MGFKYPHPPHHPTSIYSQANLRVNTEVTAEWEEPFKVSVLLQPRGFWKRLFVAWNETPTHCALIKLTPLLALVTSLHSPQIFQHVSFKWLFSCFLVLWGLLNWVSLQTTQHLILLYILLNINVHFYNKVYTDITSIMHVFSQESEISNRALHTVWICGLSRLFSGSVQQRKETCTVITSALKVSRDVT